MDLGRKPLARFPQGDQEISDERITQADLQLAVSQARPRDWIAYGTATCVLRTFLSWLVKADFKAYIGVRT